MPGGQPSIDPARVSDVGTVGQAPSAVDVADAAGAVAPADRLEVLRRQFADSQALAHVGSWERHLSAPRAVWSDEACRIYGQPLGFAPTSEQLLELIHPEDVHIVVNQLERTRRGERDEAWYRIVRPSGEIRYVHCVAEGRRDADGTLRYRYGTVQDVTESRQAERAGRVAIKLFEASFAHAAAGMALTSLDGQWLKVNPALCAIVGWSADELLERRFQDIVHPADLPDCVQCLETMRTGQTASYQAERRYLTRSGAVVWVMLSVALVRDAAGRPLHYIHQIQDISSQKEAQDQLQQAERTSRLERDHARAILDAMSDGYALTMNGEVQAVNDALCAMTGFASEQLIGVTVPYPFWPPEELPAILQTHDQVQEENGGRYEVTLMRAGGERFEAEVTTRPVCDDGGRAIGFVNTFRDVSVQKRHERELERLARTDSLTLLSNRHVLQEALGRESARRGEDGRKLALVLLDLDHFKEINDRFGHPAGDAVLVEVARRLERTVRAGEVLARVGGEEFAWLLPAASIDEAVAAANRARAAIGSGPFEPAGRLTMSAGVAVVAPPSDADVLYRMADRALYEAKQRGRDRTCWREGPFSGGDAGDAPVSPLAASA